MLLFIQKLILVWVYVSCCWSSIGRYAFSILSSQDSRKCRNRRRMNLDDGLLRRLVDVRSSTTIQLLSSSSSSSPSPLSPSSPPQTKKDKPIYLRQESDELLSPPLTPPPEKKETMKKIVASMAKSERRAMERNLHGSPRELCAKCQRPLVQCVCDALPLSKISTPNTDILILQHPTEFRRKTFSTVPLIKLNLENVRVVVGHNFDTTTPGIKEAIDNHSTKLLLFPSDDATILNDEWKKKMTIDEEELKDLQPSTALLLSNKETQQQQSETSNENTVAADTRSILHRTRKQSLVQQNNNDSNKTLLVLIDGTWTQAARMARNSPELLEVCQQVQFEKSDTPNNEGDDTSSMSIYDAIRKEPDRHCLSTLEACSKALEYLEEPETAELASRHLHAALQSLVDIQLRYTSRSADPRFVDRRFKVSQRRQRRQELEMELLGVSTEEDALVVDGQTFTSNENENDLQRQRQHPQQSLPSQSKIGIPMPGSSGSNHTVLADGAVLRNLRLEDAPFMNSRWPYRSKKGIRSLAMIERILIQQLSAESEHCCCIGIYGNLDKVNEASEYEPPRAFIVQYENGALGMLHVEEKYRRKGYGEALVDEATRRAQTKLKHASNNNERGHDPVFAFILDGNTPSEKLFAKLGWTLEKQDPNRKRGTGKRRAKRKWFKRNS